MVHLITYSLNKLEHNSYSSRKEVIKIAIAVNGGHISRALDFYNAVGKYFIIGGTEPWEDESVPTPPSPSDFKLRDVVGLKKVDNCHLVVPDTKGTIQYRNQNWRIVTDSIKTTVSTGGVTIGTNVIPVENLQGILVGSKLRINNLYEGKVSSISGNRVTLDTPAPTDIPAGSIVLGGAMVEGAKYVYVDCYLNYDEFPIITYRQVGLCTAVTPNTENILLSAKYTSGGINDEYTSLGTLEILDNRVPATRDISQRELLSVIVEF